MTLSSLASKEFDTTDPELAKHLSNANYIASQIGAGLKVILPSSGTLPGRGQYPAHRTVPEYEIRQKHYKTGR